MSLSVFMRRLLTGYAVYFNRRHKRCGHLFQNRYKSIVVDNDAYFFELIRYIHLNPLRSGIVSDLTALSRWPFSGHKVLMGNADYAWFDRNATLKCFAQDTLSARKRISEFMNEGLLKDGLPDSRSSDNTLDDLEQHQLISSANKPSPIRPERFIIGNIMTMNPGLMRTPFMQTDKSEVCEKICRNEDISIEVILQMVASHYKLTINEFCSATKRPAAVRARNAVIWIGIKHLGLTPKELSNAIGISPSTISGIISSRKGENDYSDILLSISVEQWSC
jgi:hypothetical protein